MNENQEQTFDNLDQTDQSETNQHKENKTPIISSIKSKLILYYYEYKKPFLITAFSVLFLLIIFVYFLFFRPIKGTSNIVDKTFELGVFDSVIVDIDSDIYLSQSDSTSYIQGDDNIVNLIDIKKDGSTIKIYKTKYKSIKPTDRIKIYLNSLSYRNIYLNKDNVLRNVHPFLKSTNLSIVTNGSSIINLNLDVNNLETTVNGTSNIEYNGKCDNHTVKVNGTGIINSYGLIAKQSEIDIKGSGLINLFSGIGLKIRISGVGQIVYKGNPPTYSEKINGIGIVEKYFQSTNLNQ